MNFIMLLATSICVCGFSNSQCNFRQFNKQIIDEELSLNSQRRQIAKASMEKERKIITYDVHQNEYVYDYDDFSLNDQIETQYREADPKIYLNSKEDMSRIDVSKYYALPYSAICMVYTSFDTNGDGITDVTYIGSGTMVGPNVLLTAEENTYNTEYGYPTALVVTPGAHRNQYGDLTYPYGVIAWQSISRGNYHSTWDANDNWALIYLASYVGYSCGWLGVTENGISNGTKIHTLGYVDTINYEDDYTIGFVSSLGTYKFNHNDLRTYMSNGGPITNEAENIVYGIQCGARVISGGITYSQACKVSVYIRNWIQEGGGPIELTIYSNPTGGSSSSNDLGHCWLDIKNKSPYTIYVGNMSVSANSAVTIGTWHGTSHDGIYFNLEYYKSIYASNEIYPCVSYTRHLFSNQWGSVSSDLMYYDEWTLTHNCAYFAKEIWNMALPDYQISVFGVPTPSSIKSKIESFSGYQNNRTLEGTLTVGYYQGNNFINI